VACAVEAVADGPVAAGGQLGQLKVELGVAAAFGRNGVLVGGGVLGQLRVWMCQPDGSALLLVAATTTIAATTLAQRAKAPMPATARRRVFALP